MGRTGGNRCKSWGICVFFLYVVTNLTQPKKNNPLSYPLSTPVPVVDRKARVFSSGSRVSPERCSGASEPHQKLGGAISHVYKGFDDCERGRRHS